MADLKKKSGTKKGKKKQVDDAAFLDLFLQLEGNKRGLARHLGISDTAVRQRLKKIDPDGAKLEVAKAAGKVAVMIHEAKESARKKEPAPLATPPGFGAGIAEGADRFLVFERLEAYCGIIDDTLRTLREEINDHMKRPNAKLKPYYIDGLTKLISQGTKQAEVIHKIRKDLLDIKGTMIFFEAVVQVMEVYDPDVQEKLYVALTKLGATDTASLLYPAADTTA